MKKRDCGIVKDLLPLYAEEMCSEESRREVAEHIAGCAECRGVLERMNVRLEIPVDNDIRAVKDIRRKIFIKKLIAVAVAVVAVCIVAALWFISELKPETLGFEEYAIKDNVEIVVDDDGGVWLGRHSEAGSPAYVWEVRKSDGGEYYPFSPDYDGGDPVAFGFTLVTEKHNTHSVFTAYSGRMEYSLLFNTKVFPDVEYIFYYDDEKGEEYVIWEKQDRKPPMS